MFTQPKRRIKMAAMMLLLATKTITEEKTNTCMDRHRTTYHSRPQIIRDNLDSRIKTYNNEHRRQREDKKISNGKGSLGH